MDDGTMDAMMVVVPFVSAVCFFCCFCVLPIRSCLSKRKERLQQHLHRQQQQRDERQQLERRNQELLSQLQQQQVLHHLELQLHQHLQQQLRQPRQQRQQNNGQAQRPVQEFSNNVFQITPVQIFDPPPSYESVIDDQKRYFI
jgi:hypothetical protein